MTAPDFEIQPPPPRESSGFFQLLGRIFSLLVYIVILIPVLGFGALFIPGPLSQDSNIVIPHGSNAAEIGAQLSEQKAVYSSILFRGAARLVASGSLKAGEYAIPPHASPVTIAIMMHEGRSIVRLFTVAEGLTSAEVVHLLESDQTLTGSVDPIPAEGSLLPETYRYSYGDSRASLITRMQKAMQEKVNTLWASHDTSLPLKSPSEAVTMASIVEKETGKPEERPRIAGVFYNRLRQNMRLQSDPTVIYALTRGKNVLARLLSHEDLSFASPINTYVSDGLPPQPICNPGNAALEAAMHPEHNDFLYFVADGTGGHAFSVDLATQNENINRWHRAQDKAATHP